MERGSNAERLLSRKAKWRDDVLAVQKLFAEHVYENPDLKWWDALQHRSSLLDLLSKADRLTLDYLEMNGFDRSAEFVREIEEVSKLLLKELIEWHTPADYEDPVPTSFKEGMKEAADGKLVDFPGGEA